MQIIEAATEENLNFSKEAAPEITIKVACKNDKEVEIFYKKIIRFIRRVGHIKKQKVNYEIVLESLENRTTRIIRNKSSVTDINENGKTAPEVPVQEQPRKFVPEDSNGICINFEPTINTNISKNEEIQNRIETFILSYTDYLKEATTRANQGSEIDEKAIYALGDAVRVMHHIKKIIERKQEPLNYQGN